MGIFFSIALSNRGLLTLIREVLQTESGSIFGKVRVKVLPGRVKVHTNMCEPKVCSANRKLIFGFMFGLASSDGEATGDVQEDFGGNPVALESQSDKVALARKNVFINLACFFFVWGGTDNRRGSSRTVLHEVE